MGLSREDLKLSIDAIGRIEPRFAALTERIGYPEPRTREPGYETLLRTIVGQQVSVASAAAIWRKLESALGQASAPQALLESDSESLRACGLSRQKQSYARSLAEHVVSGTLDLSALPADDEAAIDKLIQIKGIGRWSAEIYLLFAEGRPDIWPAGDLAVQVAVGRIMELDTRPKESAVRAIAEAWRPHRGAAAIMAWHHYNAEGGIPV